MPIDIPLWMVAVSTIFAVIIGKEVFGGTVRLPYYSSSVSLHPFSLNAIIPHVYEGLITFDYSV